MSSNGLVELIGLTILFTLSPRSSWPNTEMEWLIEDLFMVAVGKHHSEMMYSHKIYYILWIVDNMIRLCLHCNQNTWVQQSRVRRDSPHYFPNNPVTDCLLPILKTLRTSSLEILVPKKRTFPHNNDSIHFEEKTIACTFCGFSYHWRSDWIESNYWGEIGLLLHNRAKRIMSGSQGIH